MIRVIPRLDIKNSTVVKGIQLEGLRVVGDAAELAKRYDAQGADELLLLDAVASLYSRLPLYGQIERITDGIFTPVTVGGGLRSLSDMRAVLLVGADKVVINTAAIARPELISEAADRFGSQAVVVSLEVKGRDCFTDSGREPTGLDAVTWAKRTAELGAGEILVTSIDRDGTMRGFDVDLIRAIAAAVDIPVVACGGYGSADDAVGVAFADAIAVGAALHAGKTTVNEIKRSLAGCGARVRVAA